MVDTAHVDLSSRVLGQVVHDVVTHILDGSVAAERDATDRIHSDVIEQGYGHCVSDVFEDFLREGRTICICVDLRVRICHRRFLFNVTLSFNEFGCECVDSLAVVVVALESVAVCEAGGFLQRHATASISTHPVLVLYGHNLLGKVALIHVEVEAVHGDQLCKCNIVSLPIVIW